MIGKHSLLSLLITGFLSGLVPGDSVGGPAPSGGEGIRPVHTYSIVARDPQTGDLGVAVQSHWFSVGPLVPWAEAGVGAVATQSLVEVSYGPLGLELMRAGKTAEESLRALLAADPVPEIRQVAMVDAGGTVVAHTGSRCIAEAGHRVGENYSVQANLMLKDTVWEAMAKAFEGATGGLAERMLVALEAAQEEGGDIRGKQSAAVLVVRGTATGRSWEDRRVDLRVEDHPDPVKELRRLLKLHRAYEHMNRGDEAIAEENIELALEEYVAAEELVPDNVEMVFWHAVTLVSIGKLEESLPLFARTFRKDRNWLELVPRLVKAELLPADPAVLEAIRRAGKGDR